MVGAGEARGNALMADDYREKLCLTLRSMSLQTCRDAADEIDRLVAENERARQAIAAKDEEIYLLARQARRLSERLFKLAMGDEAGGGDGSA
jgi:hypothetical protein